MSDPEYSPEALAELFADAVDEDEIGLELLVRFETNRPPLDPAERERVEHYLAESPADRDRLRMAVRFAEGGLGAFEEAPGAVVIPFRRRPAVRAAVGLALAASLALVLWAQFAGRSSAPEPSRSPEIATTEPTPAPRLARPLLPPVEPQRQPEQPEEVGQLLIAREPAEEVGMPEAPPAPPAPTPPPVAVEIAVADPAAPEVIEPPAAIEDPFEGESFVIAMNTLGAPGYLAPSGSGGLPHLGASRSVAAAALTPSIEVLAPAHTGLTLEESPTLYWYLASDSDLPAEVTLITEDADEPLLELALDGPLAAGFHAVSLRENGVELEAGVPYQWFVAVSPDASDRTQDMVAGGEIERIDGSAELERTLAAGSAASRGHALAAGGIWYDALEHFSRAIAAHPGDATLWEMRSELLSQADLDEAAAYVDE